MTAYKTISATSQALDLPPSTLRFWEKEFKQIKPQVINKRRYYSQEDIKLIANIKELLQDKGYTLAGAKKYLKEQKLVIECNNKSQSMPKNKLKELITMLMSAKKELENNF